MTLSRLWVHHEMVRTTWYLSHTMDLPTNQTDWQSTNLGHYNVILIGATRSGHSCVSLVGALWLESNWVTFVSWVSWKTIVKGKGCRTKGPLDICRRGFRIFLSTNYRKCSRMGDLGCDSPPLINNAPGWFYSQLKNVLYPSPIQTFQSSNSIQSKIIQRIKS